MDAGRLTPSGYHDNAWRRIPKHDVMQKEVLEYLRAKPAMADPGVLSGREVEGEYPLTKRGQVISFVDAIEIFHVEFRRYVTLFEIKPQIETVFGIVRQAKAQLELAIAQFDPSPVALCIIVPHTDPLLADLRVEWPHTWAWGIQFPEEGSLGENS